MFILAQSWYLITLFGKTLEKSVWGKTPNTSHADFSVLQCKHVFVSWLNKNDSYLQFWPPAPAHLLLHLLHFYPPLRRFLASPWLFSSVSLTFVLHRESLQNWLINWRGYVSFGQADTNDAETSVAELFFKIDKCPVKNVTHLTGKDRLLPHSSAFIFLWTNV